MRLLGVLCPLCYLSNVWSYKDDICRQGAWVLPWLDQCPESVANPRLQMASARNAHHSELRKVLIISQTRFKHQRVPLVKSVWCPQARSRELTCPYLSKPWRLMWQSAAKSVPLTRLGWCTECATGPMLRFENHTHRTGQTQ